MKNNMKKILLLTGVLCLASVGGVSAYLTDYDKVSNQFTVGKVDVELTEDNWKPDDHKKIEPGKVISKDPRIKNTGIFFISVKSQLDKTEFTEGWKQAGICFCV